MKRIPLSIKVAILTATSFATLLAVENVCPGKANGDICRIGQPGQSACDSSESFKDRTPSYNYACKKYCIKDGAAFFCPTSGSCCRQTWGEQTETGCYTTTQNLDISYRKSPCTDAYVCLNQWEVPWEDADQVWTDQTVALEDRCNAEH